MKKNKLPDFYGVLEIKHYTKGRMRLFIKSLINKFEISKALEEKFIKIDGINEIKVNVTLGNVIIKFDENKIEPPILVGAILQVLGLEKEAFGKKQTKISKFMGDLLSTVDTTIYNKTRGMLDTKSALFILFTVYGIRKLKTNPVLPNGVNLLWWAYNMIGKGEK